MHPEIYVGLVVIISFAAIQFVEVLSFFARTAGVLMGARSTAYVTQQAVMTLTRAFMLMLLPLLGYLVDSKTGPTWFLLVAIGAHVFSFLLMSALLLTKRRWLQAFSKFMAEFRKSGRFVLSFAKLPMYLLSSSKDQQIHLKAKIDRRIFFLSAMVFFVYGASIFFVFYIALVVHEYRATLSQMSGAINALAAVVLTFKIEPQLSLVIDSEDGDVTTSYSALMSLIYGRVFGVGVIGALLFTSILIWSGAR